jgi:acetyl-CoA carboxylase biotin carboxyl carrier protein
VPSEAARDRNRPMPEKLRGDAKDTRDIKALLVLMQEYGVVELEIEDRRGKVRLVRGGAAESDVSPVVARASAKPIRPAHRVNQVEAKTEDAGAGAGPVELAPNQKLIESPMVGTFYRAASPDAGPFVEEGSSVRKGQPLCIIEAMKMMNEIEAPAAGRIVRIIANNAQPVEYGQPLMILEVA